MFSLLSGVWSLAGSWWVRFGGKHFPGLNALKKKKKKDLGRNILTLAPSYSVRARFPPPSFWSLIRWQPLAFFAWSDDGPESPVPSRGESAPFAHIMGRLEGILLDSNDVLSRACLGDPAAFDILHDTQGVLHHAEMRGRPPLPLSTNLVHFLPCCCFL